MSEYGQLINFNYNPIKKEVYDAFVNYYNNPVLTKIKDAEIYSVYMSKINSMISSGNRYLVLLIDKNFESNGTTKYMKDCEWVSLQTRTLTENHDIKYSEYVPTLKTPLNEKITLVSRNEKQTLYKCETFPININMLHPKNNKYKYVNNGTIVSALETFQTVINFNK